MYIENSDFLHTISRRSPSLSPCMSRCADAGTRLKEALTRFGDVATYCVWCSVVQRGVVWCSMVQCGAVWCSVVQRIVVTRAGEVLRRLWCVASVLHCVAVWCSALQCAVECCSVVQSVAVTRSSDAATYTNVAVCCSLLQSVAVSQ